MLPSGRGVLEVRPAIVRPLLSSRRAIHPSLLLGRVLQRPRRGSHGLNCTSGFARNQKMGELRAGREPLAVPPRGSYQR